MKQKSNKRKFNKTILIFGIVLGVICAFFLVRYKQRTLNTYSNEQFFPYQDTYDEVLSFESETDSIYYNHQENDNYLECGTFQYYYTVYEYYDAEDDYYYLFLGSWVDISPENSSSEYYSVNKGMYQSFSVTTNDDVNICSLSSGPSALSNAYDLSVGTNQDDDSFNSNVKFTNYKKYASKKYVDTTYKCNYDTKVYSYSFFRIDDFSQYGSITFTFDYLSEASFYVNGPLLENYNVETDDDLNNISTTKEFSYTYSI